MLHAFFINLVKFLTRKPKTTVNLERMEYALNPSDGGYCSMQLTILHHHTGDLSDREPNY